MQNKVRKIPVAKTRNVLYNKTSAYKTTSSLALFDLKK